MILSTDHAKEPLRAVVSLAWINEADAAEAAIPKRDSARSVAQAFANTGVGVVPDGLVVIAAC
jgi:hypothetical protein